MYHFQTFLYKRPPLYYLKILRTLKIMFLCGVYLLKCTMLQNKTETFWCVLFSWNSNNTHFNINNTGHENIVYPISPPPPQMGTDGNYIKVLEISLVSGKKEDNSKFYLFPCSICSTALAKWMKNLRISAGSWDSVQKNLVTQGLPWPCSETCWTVGFQNLITFWWLDFFF
jgi:hypothetical protein